jgi:hypothetical protein
MAIIALLSSMMVIIPSHENPKEQVDLAAAQVAAMFKQARKLALETKENFAVVIHIENSGDSSVIKNFSQFYDGAPFGRHWIAVIGPDTGFATNSRNDPPLPSAYPHLQSYERAVNLCMINRVYLPPGTRFLAVGDVDGGNKSTAKDYFKGDDSGRYPLPWFGWYDDTENRLHPWGGYDHPIDVKFIATDSDITSGCTGLLFSGRDGEIPYDETLDCCVNPKPTYGKHFPHALQMYPGTSRQSGARISH